LLELGAATGVAGAFTGTVAEVAIASVVDITVKDLKLPGGRHQIGPPCCTAISRSPLPGAPTVRGWDLADPQGGYPAVVG
jgi:hypothetical protein